LTPAQSALLKRLQDRAQAVATELAISVEVLATRRDLTALVRGARDVPPLCGWRAAVIGAPLLAAL
jgi:hypothetical protein